MVGRVCPRHGYRGRPLNSAVRRHLDAPSQQIPLARCSSSYGRGHIARILHLGAVVSRSSAKRSSSVSDGVASCRLSGCFGGSRYVVVSVERNCPIKPLGVRSLHRHCFRRLGISHHQQLVWPRFPLKEAQMTSNNALERTVGHRGPRLAAARSPWPAAQLGR